MMEEYRMDLSLLSPYIRRALDHRAQLGWELKERVLFDYELLYVKNGEIIVQIEHDSYHGIPGDLFLFKPRQAHSIRQIGTVPLHQPHVHFDLIQQPDSPDVKISFNRLQDMTDSEKSWFRPDLCSEPPFQLPNRFRFRNPLPFETMLMELIHEMEHQLPFYELKARSTFLGLWTFLLREWYKEEHPDWMTNWEMYMLLKPYLLTNLHRQVSLDEMAQCSRMSKTSLIRFFRAAFGVTPVKYHQLLRIEKAKELIQFSSAPITRISDELGFDSIHAFSRAFRRLEGVAPTFYRRHGG
jgi:AraC-like DNA-binding protein